MLTRPGTKCQRPKIKCQPQRNGIQALIPSWTSCIVAHRRQRLLRSRDKVRVTHNVLDQAGLGESPSSLVGVRERGINVLATGGNDGTVGVVLDLAAKRGVDERADRDLNAVVWAGGADWGLDIPNDTAENGLSGEVTVGESDSDVVGACSHGYKSWVAGDLSNLNVSEESPLALVGI